MSICLLNDAFPPIIDGVCNAVVNYAGVLTERHDHALVVTPACPGADDSIYPFPVLRYPSIDTRKRIGYVAGQPFSPEVLRRLKEEKVSLLHAHCPFASVFLARPLREMLDVPLVLTYHTKYDIDIAHALRGKQVQKQAIRALVQNVSACDEVWAVSRGAGENLRSLGYTGDILLMENGVDLPKERVSPEAAAKAAEGLDLPSGVPVFLFIGRLMWYKGLRIILDALAMLHRQGILFRMVFIGDGTDGEAVRAYAREQELEAVCFFPGAIRNRETIRAWYCRADLFLFPSAFDTNGLVVREAAACSLPSVLIRGSCAAEGVTDGVSGFLIDESAEALASVLSRLCAHPEQLRTVGDGAAQQLYLSWEDAIARANERYQIVLDRYRAGHCHPKRSRADAFFRSEGELMEALLRFEDLRSRPPDHPAKPCGEAQEVLKGKQDHRL